MSWSKDKGWLVVNKIGDPEAIISAQRLRLLGNVVLVRTNDKAWAECEGIKIE